MWQSKQSCHWWDCNAQGACTSMPMLVPRALNNLLNTSSRMGHWQGQKPAVNTKSSAQRTASTCWLPLVILVPPGYPGSSWLFLASFFVSFSALSGSFWLFLGPHGSPWLFLGLRAWFLLAFPGASWHFLVPPGSSSLCQGLPGSSWLFLALGPLKETLVASFAAPDQPAW